MNRAVRHNTGQAEVRDRAPFSMSAGLEGVPANELRRIIEDDLAIARETTRARARLLEDLAALPDHIRGELIMIIQISESADEALRPAIRTILATDDEARIDAITDSFATHPALAEQWQFAWTTLRRSAG